jgi:hypothetical protein
MAGMQRYLNDIVVSGEVLVYRVVDDFPNAVMKGGAVVRVAEVHTGSFSNGFQAFQDLNALCAIIVGH